MTANTSLSTSIFAGLVAVSTMTMFVAAMPAHAATPVTEWQTNVEKQIDQHLTIPANAFKHQDRAIAQVRVHFDADGKADNVSLAKGSGDTVVDAEALRTANAVNYPLLPTELRGQERNILVQVYFADGSTPVREEEATQMQLAAHRSAEQLRVQTAARNTN